MAVAAAAAGAGRAGLLPPPPATAPLRPMTAAARHALATAEQRFTARWLTGLNLLHDVCGLPRVLGELVASYVTLTDAKRLAQHDCNFRADEWRVGVAGVAEPVLVPWSCPLVVAACFTTLRGRVVELEHALKHVLRVCASDNLQRQSRGLLSVRVVDDFAPFADTATVDGFAGGAVLDAARWLQLWHALVLADFNNNIADVPVLLSSKRRSSSSSAHHKPVPRAARNDKKPKPPHSGGAAAAAGGGAAAPLSSSEPAWTLGTKARSVSASLPPGPQFGVARDQLKDACRRLLALVDACAYSADTLYLQQLRVRRARLAAAAASPTAPRDDIPPEPPLPPMPGPDKQCVVRLWAAPVGALGLIAPAPTTPAAATARSVAGAAVCPLDEVEHVRLAVQFGARSALCVDVSTHAQCCPHEHEYDGDMW